MPSWFDTFFARLVLVQLLLSLLLLGLFWGWGARKQGEDLAKLQAPLFAAALKSNTLLPGKAQHTSTIELMPGPPPAEAMNGRLLWRYRALPEALKEFGVDVSEVRLSGHEGDAITWLKVDGRAQGQDWVGLRGSVGGRGLWYSVAMASCVAVVAILCAIWWLSRWVERPLGDLQQAMRRFKLDGVVPLQSTGRGVPLELGELAQQFAMLAQQQQTDAEQRRIMLAGISHDLRTPLSRIRLTAELLPHSPEIARRQAAIARDVQLADRLLGSFIDYARAEDEPVSGQVDLRALVMAVAEDSEDLELGDVPAQAQWLQPASAVALERALRNLLDNARQHGAAPICLAMRCDAKGSMLSVRDHGPGIPAGAVNAMMQPFVRGEANRRKPGTGLGLAIVHRTALRHGGRLVLADAAPGLRVELQLPACGAGLPAG
jgi:two-component system osmolarity sensor histidine kinase EnvZ